MTATVTIVFAEKDDVVAVPNAALRFRPPPEVASADRRRRGRPRRRARARRAWAGGAGRVRSQEPSARRGAARRTRPSKRTRLRAARRAAPSPCTIVTGLTDGTVTEVVSGELEAGDQVVIGRHHQRQARAATRRGRRRAAAHGPHVLTMAGEALIDRARTSRRSTRPATSRCTRSRACRSTIAVGRVRRDHGLVGLRQVDADEHPRLPRPPDHGHLHARRARGRVDGRDELAEVRNEVLGFVFQSFNLLARTSALENVELPLVYAACGTRSALVARREALERVGLGGRARPHARAALRRPAAARRDRARARRRARRSSSPTSRPATSTRRRASRSWRSSRSSGRAGITVVLVTHEPDIAEYASRVIVVKDGRHPVGHARQPSARRPSA